MKNMKKLLGAMAALGFSTVAAINVVACSTPQASNDLTKSFKSSYTSYIDGTDATAIKAIGLTMKDANTYTYKFTDITDPGIKGVITTDTGVPVNKGITVAPTLPAATKAGDEIAQVVASTKDGDLTVSGTAATVKIVVTLKLYKADDKMAYQDQKTTMDVTLSIDTKFQPVDISSGVSVTDPKTITANPANTYGQLNTDTTIAKLVTDAINVKQGKTDAALTTDFTLKNDQTEANKQEANKAVKFTVTAAAGSTKLVAGKTFTFTITLIAQAQTVDVSTITITDPGNITHDNAKIFGDLNTDTRISNLVIAAINDVKPDTNAVLETDFTLGNDKTATDNQTAGAVKFTVSVVSGSTKLTQGKTKDFTITLT